MRFKRMPIWLALLGIGFVLFAASGGAQATGPEARNATQVTPAYDVASVKQNLSPNASLNLDFTPDGVKATGVTLLWAMSEAYGMRDLSLISGGPAWTDEKRFDIEAKYDVTQYPNLTREQKQEMLQKLLSDRFKLVVHKEAKQFPLYALVVAKSGVRFVEAKPHEIQQDRMGGPVCHITGNLRSVLKLQGCSSGDLANVLYGAAKADLGRRVVDQTGLKGRYTFELHWAPLDAANPAAATPSADSASGPSIFTALKEQLGLELRPTKGPIETLVIDRAEMPSEN